MSSRDVTRQFEAPRVLDIQQETQATQQLYGIGERKRTVLDASALIARRLAQAGVRFIQVTNKGWDHHGSIDKALTKKCREVDQPIAGLLTDLKRAGTAGRHAGCLDRRIRAHAHGAKTGGCKR